MTDIDALIAETRDWLDFVEGSPLTGEKLAERLLDALTTERAKVAALEKENAKFRTMLGGSTALAEGLGIRVDAVMHEVALAAYKQLEEAKAEVARWREVAGELAGALRKELFEAVNCWVHHDGESPEGSAEPEHIIQGRAALTRFKQEGGQ